MTEKPMRTWLWFVIAVIGALVLVEAALAQQRPTAQAQGAHNRWQVEGETAGSPASGPASAILGVKPAQPAAPQTVEQQRLRRINAVRRWGYQLRLIDPSQIRGSPFDMVVIDHAISAFRRFVREFKPEEIAKVRDRADGAPRIALAYMSIGEAERYRFYWQQEWYDPARKPAWLGEVNPLWEGNYIVRFWDPAWQAMIFGSPESYVERIIAQGFDGIYLDRADVFLEFKKQVPDAEKRMVDFITRLVAHARAIKPDILIVMQNAEELLAHASVRTAIDAIAKEDLFFGIDHKEGRNAADTIDWSIQELMRARKASRAVFVVEYLSDPAKIAEAERIAARSGFHLHVTARDLGQLSVVPPRPVVIPGRG